MTNAKNTSIGHWPITLLNGLSAIIGLLLPMLMSRILPAEEIGKYKILFLYIMMVPALSFSAGIENGVYYWAGLASGARERIRSAWSLAMVQAFVFFLIVIISSHWSRHWFGWSVRQFTAFAFATLMVVLSSFYESLLIATNRIWKGAIFGATFNSLNNIVILAAIVYFKSAEMAVWAYVLMCVLKIACTIFMGSRDGWIPLKPEFSEVREVLKYHMPVSTSGIFDFLMNNSDRFILSMIISPAQYAIYTFGCLSLPPLQILESSVNRVMIPRLTSAIEKKDHLHAAHLYRSGMEQIMMIYIPAVVGLFVFANPIIKLLFTAKYLEAANFLRLYCVWYLLSGIPYDVAARASGNGKWILKNTIRMGIFSLAVCSLLTYLWGAYGALAALLITLTVQKSLGFNLMINTYHWQFSEMIPWKGLGLFASLASVLGIVSWFLSPFFINPLYWFLIVGGMFAVIYLGTVFIVRRDLFRH